MSKASSQSPARILAIVVAYHPDRLLLQRQLEAVRDQVDGVIVVDNGNESEFFERQLQAGRIDSLIQPGENLGVAGGVNRGLARTRELRARTVLLLDQDSVPADGMVERLSRASHSLRQAGEPVAAVGPVLRDRTSGQRGPFIRYRFPGYRRLRGVEGTVRCDFLITSGSLIDIAVFDQVGEMDEGLFIDNVDLEWCFRARRNGLTIHGVFDAELEHSVGERKRLVRWLPVPYAHHPPVRLYYMVRNGLLVYRDGGPPAWVTYDALRLLSKFVIYAFVRPRGKNLSAMMRGFVDGLRGRRGRSAPMALRDSD